jgi:hypothetical protein
MGLDRRELFIIRLYVVRNTITPVKLKETQELVTF